MPTYQYACTQCDDRLEAVQSFSDAALTECPACGGALRKVFSAVGVVFKGSGFYKNDSRGPAAGEKAGADKGSGDKGGADKSAGDKSGADGSSSNGSSGDGGSSKDAGAKKKKETAPATPSTPAASSA